MNRLEHLLTEQLIKYHVPGIFKKEAVPINTPIRAGGIKVNPGDIIVADEEGIAVIPKDRAEEIYQECKEKVKKEAALSFEEWADRHKKNIDSFYEQFFIGFET